MSAKGKGKAKKNSKASQLSKGQKYYVYFSTDEGLKLYCSRLSGASVDRIEDLTFHLAGAHTLHRAKKAYVVSSKSMPPQSLRIEDPQETDFARFNLKLHYRRDF